MSEPGEFDAPQDRPGVGVSRRVVVGSMLATAAGAAVAGFVGGRATATDGEARCTNGELVIPADAHVRLVRGMPMLRRSYADDYGWLLTTAGGSPDPLAAAAARTEAEPHTHAPGDAPEEPAGMPVGAGLWT